MSIEKQKAGKRDEFKLQKNKNKSTINSDKMTQSNVSKN